MRFHARLGVTSIQEDGAVVDSATSIPCEAFKYPYVNKSKELKSGDRGGHTVSSLPIHRS
jgi:hypothetical protein